VPDPWSIIEALHDSLDELRIAADGKTPVDH
jgi:hypothetical protein